MKNTSDNQSIFLLRGRDLNPRSRGYGPREMPDFSTPRYFVLSCI